MPNLSIGKRKCNPHTAICPFNAGRLCLMYHGIDKIFVMPRHSGSRPMCAAFCMVGYYCNRNIESLPDAFLRIPKARPRVTKTSTLDGTLVYLKACVSVAINKK